MSILTLEHSQHVLVGASKGTADHLSSSGRRLAWLEGMRVAGSFQACSGIAGRGEGHGVLRHCAAKTLRNLTYMAGSATHAPMVASHIQVGIQPDWSSRVRYVEPVIAAPAADDETAPFRPGNNEGAFVPEWAHMQHLSAESDAKRSKSRSVEIVEKSILFMYLSVPLALQHADLLAKFLRHSSYNRGLPVSHILHLLREHGKIRKACAFPCHRSKSRTEHREG